ncbi:DUF6476 family protein [Aliiroseovarius sp. PrR006]|uniref:DUF6476 family protein n=1 Tax=Aliiroseovarius sp. PrR006 TaxID=2706883 RepID=UPI0013D801F2|nr:DUF6476 family protein [Aliiroseovarius sp. PrR006]NDW53479.1 hypothetical protein [Aliiroseovarius sp. PrR006]
MDKTPEQELDAALEDSVGLGTVRYLKTIVTAMTVATILGMIVLITVVVMRFSQTSPTANTLPLPDQITLPEGVTAETVTLGRDWIGVVSGDEILIYETDGQLRKRINLR